MSQDPAYSMLAYLTLEDIAQLKSKENDVLVVKSIAQAGYSAEVTSDEGLIEALKVGHPRPY